MLHFLQAGHGVLYLVAPTTVESLHPLRNLDAVPPRLEVSILALPQWVQGVKYDSVVQHIAK
jgi:hypothetical protein